jgi:bacterioferritin-associated ferredoxin
VPNKKKIVCRCVDVTEYELEKTIKQGRRDIESLKRVKGIGTGPCQGKSCMSHVVGMLARANKKSPDDIGTMKSRQPVDAVELNILAMGDTGRKPMPKKTSGDAEETK